MNVELPSTCRTYEMRVGLNWGREGGGGDFVEFKGVGMSSKPGERGEAYFSFVQWNLDITKLDIKKVIGILNDIFCPSYGI